MPPYLTEPTLPNQTQSNLPITDPNTTENASYPKQELREVGARCRDIFCENTVAIVDCNPAQPPPRRQETLGEPTTRQNWHLLHTMTPCAITTKTLFWRIFYLFQTLALSPRHVWQYFTPRRATHTLTTPLKPHLLGNHTVSLHRLFRRDEFSIEFSQALNNKWWIRTSVLTAVSDVNVFPSKTMSA